MHGVIHMQGSEYWYASIKCKHHRTQVLLEVVKKCTYLWASIVWPSPMLSPLHWCKVRRQDPPRRDEGHSSRNTVTLHESSPPQWMTAAGVAWTVGHQANYTSTSCLPPPPSSPLSHSPMWGWGLRERHKQKGRTVRRTANKQFCGHSSPSVSAKSAGTQCLLNPPRTMDIYLHNY